MECFGITDFDNNSQLITSSAIIISGLHCICYCPMHYIELKFVICFPEFSQNLIHICYCQWASDKTQTLNLMWVWPCIVVNMWKWKGQLDATDGSLLQNLLFAQHVSGHHYAHHLELKSIIQVVAACGTWCFGLQVVGLVWSCWLCVRFAGCCI
jgi:hypothetical protein